MILNILLQALTRKTTVEQALNSKTNTKRFKRFFSGIGCFDGTLSLQIKLDSKQYQVLPRLVAYILQKSFKEELERLQQPVIITP